MDTLQAASLDIDRIRDEMRKRDWNQSDLARATNIARTTISRRLSGKLISITGPTVARFARALDLPPGELLQ